MHRQHTQGYYTREQIFNDKFPLSVIAILAIIQMLTTFGIIALEIGHIVINIKLTNLFAGIWTSLPFTILWISMFATVCCCRRRSCAIHAVLQNCISLVFAFTLIAINIAFLRRPDECFFTTEMCNSLSWTHDITIPLQCFNGNRENCDDVRLTLIKAQLGAAILMAAMCFTYLMLYSIIASRVSRALKRQIHAPGDAVMGPVYQAPATSVINYQHQPFVNVPNAYQPTPSAPVMMPTYQSSATYQPTSLGNYIPAIYPQIPNDRF